MADQNTTASTDLALPLPSDAETLFAKPEAVIGLIEKIEAEVRSYAPDLSTKKGRDAIASLAHKVSKSKTYLDGEGKKLTEDMKRQVSAVDAQRKVIRDRLDALRDEARAPLTKWEADEEARIAGLKGRLKRLVEAAPSEDTAAAYAAMIGRVEAVQADESWHEFAGLADQAKSATLARLRSRHEALATIEAERAELAHLRAENERLAAEKAERDRIEAERIERERAELEAREAEAVRVRDAEEAERRRAAEAERIEREKAEAAARAAREAEERAARQRAEDEERHRRELAEAMRREEEAAQRERERIAAERKAEDDARAKREADAQHRAKIVQDIADALATMRGNSTPHAIAEALVSGKIPHVKIII